MDIEATTTQPSAGAEELPVIWLEALLASDHTTKLYPLPIAISATLLSLILLTLFILYNKKPRATDTQTHKRLTDASSPCPSPPIQQPGTHTQRLSSTTPLTHAASQTIPRLSARQPVRVFAAQPRHAAVGVDRQLLPFAIRDTQHGSEFRLQRVC
ncbi:hypothetical protein EJ07DRAFT_170715 [Lizonia empirigonia]|nr:hypothetical protein EJ07DRAFT_170715 [Lizonia empirigonia]